MNQGTSQNPFEQFLIDTVMLRKADGCVHTDIKALVQNGQISIFDVSLPIDPEDRLTRTLPSGQVEEFVVEEANYSESFHAIPAHWTIKCRRGNQRPQDARSITYNLSGPNSRINVHSHDHSTNIIREDLHPFFRRYGRPWHNSLRMPNEYRCWRELRVSKARTAHPALRPATRSSSRRRPII